MPPKKATNAADGETPIGLTDGELRFIKAVFDNMTQKPDADWPSVATDLGLKDAKCAKERFRQMSVRHGWRDQSNGAAASGSPRKPRAAAASVSGSPKVTKKRATPRKKVKKDEDDDDEGVKPEEDVKVEEDESDNST